MRHSPNAKGAHSMVGETDGDMAREIQHVLWPSYKKLNLKFLPSSPTHPPEDFNSVWKSKTRMTAQFFHLHMCALKKKKKGI